jgi:hypothetical protein
MTFDRDKGVFSRVTGGVLRAAGWSTLAVGLLVSFGAAVTLQLLFPRGVAGYLVAVPLSVLSLLASVLMIRGGRSLTETGHQELRSERERAIWSLAESHRGVLTPRDVARTTSMSEDEADSLLTSLAERSLDVQVDVDDARGLVYRFPVRARVADEVVSADEWQPPRATAKGPFTAS